MSNAEYRKTDRPLSAKELRRTQVQAARKVIEEIACISEMHAEMVQKMIGLRFETLGGSLVEADMKSLQLIIKSGNLSRDLEVLLQERALARLKDNLPPEENPARIPVSAGTHRGAIRDHQKLLEKRAEILDQCSLDVADELAKMGKQIMAAPETRPPEKPAQDAPKQQTPQVKQANAPPRKAAA